MDSSLASAIAASASAIAAFASFLVSVRLAKLTSRSLQIQIQPSIAIKFDHRITDDREKTAGVINDSACEIYDLYVRVSIVSDFEVLDGGIRPVVSRSVANHDLQRWFIPRFWRRRLGAGDQIEIDSDPWFTHAREVLSLPNLTPAERDARGTVVIDMTCRRAADNRRFEFRYVYMVHGRGSKLVALPVSGSNPADAESRIIVRPVDD